MAAVCFWDLPLFAKAPNELFAVAAERGLFEESRQELVIFHADHMLLTQSTAASELFERLVRRATATATAAASLAPTAAKCRCAVSSSATVSTSIATIRTHP